MNPNQPTPNQTPAPEPQPQPVVPLQPPVSPQQPVPQPVTAPVQPAQPGYPQPPSSYAPATPQQAYDPNYLDSIAPAPPRAKFFSGSFGKIFFVLIGLFVFAVSLIIAFSGGDDTADLQQMAVRLDNFALVAKTSQKNFKSNNLQTTNSNFEIWLTGNKAEAEKLLDLGGVKKTDYSKKMVADEKALSEDLTSKFEDARLSARLDRIYASTMAAETEKLINLLNTMAKKNKSQKIRDFAKNASTNLTPIQKSFNDYVDDGN